MKCWFKSNNLECFFQEYMVMFVRSFIGCIVSCVVFEAIIKPSFFQCCFISPASRVKSAAGSSIRFVGYLCVLSFLCMFVFSYLSVPLYKIFCQTFGISSNLLGLGIELDEASSFVAYSSNFLDKPFSILLSTEVEQHVPLTLSCELAKIDVAADQPVLVFFRVTNFSKEPVCFTTTFSVYPHKCGVFFDKKQCFCYTDQVVEPLQSVDLPVLFVIKKQIFFD